MNRLTNLATEAQEIRLSEQEKAVMRAQIFGVSQAAPRYTVSHFQFFSIKFAPVMAALLIVMLGGGTAYAAQGALPGELLYAVKVKVNEPVREALAVSTEAKAAFHTSVAQTRLEEAEALAVEGKLNEAASVEIEERLEEHLARAEEVKAKLEKEEKEDVAVEVEAELDSALAAHSAILAKIGEESSDDETRERSRSLAGRLTSRVFARLDASMGTTMALKTVAPAMDSVSLMAEEPASSTEAAFMATNTPEVESDDTEERDETERRTAEAVKQRAHKQIETAEEVFEDLKPTLEATTTARVEAQFKMLEDQMKEGEAWYEEENYSAAQAVFGAAWRDANELYAYLRAEQRFNKKYLRSWIDDRFGAWFEPEVRGARTEPHDHNEEDRSEDKSDRDEGEGNEDESDSRGDRSEVEFKVDLGL